MREKYYIFKEFIGKHWWLKCEYGFYYIKSVNKYTKMEKERKTH